MGFRTTGVRFPGFGWSNTTFLFEGGGRGEAWFDDAGNRLSIAHSRFFSVAWQPPGVREHSKMVRSSQ